MIELECKKVRFYSQQDEEVFFSWAQSIPSVSAATGCSSSIILSLKSRVVSDRSLRELVALFHRYRVSMRQLAQFQSPRNKSWFAAKEMFWFRSVVGTGPTSRSTRSRVKRAPG
jgi:hypothetical protein